ncbi:MAG: AraC family transcriptional regulator [Lachnospiraceae bacterium]|nr:AraC family transcriptional regulator [Lachnospiraceae bacterium]MCI9200775.1 AraC family transcriptional regulator [Lachnospiraceae bacterium]
MKKNLQTAFSPRQYMLSQDFEIYYYNDSHKDRLRCQVKEHAHDYYEFYFFLEGNVSIRIDNVEHPLKTGSMVLIPPGVSHQAVIHDTEIPYRRFVFWVSGSFYTKLSEESGDYVYLMQKAQKHGKYISCYDMISFNALQSKIFRLIEEIHSERFGKTAQISLCVQDLLLHLNRTAYDKDHPNTTDKEQGLYRHLLQYIETHLDEELSLDSLAGQFYVSKYHIAHVFKENLGLSVHRYITKKRLAMCRDAILGQREIGEACLMCGFKDYSSFFRSFKKEYGLSPKAYKERFLSDSMTADL